MRQHLLAVVVALLFILVGCGVPLDDEPEFIASEALPEVLQPGPSSSTTTVPERLAEDVLIYLVDPGDGEPSLVPVERQVTLLDAQNSLELAVLEQLLAGPTMEEQLDLNLTTAVVSPEDDPLEVISVEAQGDEQVLVVLTAAPNIAGSDRLVTFAQLVFTLTELPDVSQVRFVVRNELGEDEDIAVRTDTEEGDVRRAVDRDDYLTLLPG